jgi:hypothetical protein
MRSTSGGLKHHLQLLTGDTDHGHLPIRSMTNYSQVTYRTAKMKKPGN